MLLKQLNIHSITNIPKSSPQYPLLPSPSALSPTIRNGSSRTHCIYIAPATHYLHIYTHDLYLSSHPSTYARLEETSLRARAYTGGGGDRALPRAHNRYSRLYFCHGERERTSAHRCYNTCSLAAARSGEVQRATCL